MKPSRRVVLVVDDSAYIRKLVARCLHEVGFDALEAGDGRQALAELEAHDVALIVTDFNMPVMDGLELVHAIRDGERHRFTPIVFLTTEVDEGKRREAHAAHATAWLVKPFTPERLLAIVRKVVPAT